MDYLNDIATTIGLITGVSGFSLAVLNYWRDNPKVRVELQWDLKEAGTDEFLGIIRVSNVGRRPIFVSHVALRLPKGFDESYLVLHGGIIGYRLAEGDKPLTYRVEYEGLSKYRTNWQNVRAQISDSTSKVWLSRKLNKRSKPSWAK